VIQNPQPPKSKLDVSTLTIRRMRSTDIPAIMAIEAVSFGRHHWSEESFQNEMNNHIGRYYSLFSGDTLIGYGGFWHVIDEAHVTTVAIQPEYRGHGLGELLFLQLLEECFRISIHWVTLEVRTSNESAQNLYYKYGLSSAGLRRKYYQDNQEDALIMTSPDIGTEKYRALYNSNKQLFEKRLGGFPAGFSS